MGLKGGISNDADSGPFRYIPWCCSSICHQLLIFIQIGYGHTVSEKATKVCKIFPLLFTTVHTVKSKGKISQNFVAFSEYMNFKTWADISTQNTLKYLSPFLAHLPNWLKYLGCLKKNTHWVSIVRGFLWFVSIFGVNV